MWCSLESPSLFCHSDARFLCEESAFLEGGSVYSNCTSTLGLGWFKHLVVNPERQRGGQSYSRYHPPHSRRLMRNFSKVM